MSENKIYSKGWKDYELIDAGGSKKLERWGELITVRPERQAYFQSGLPYEEWNNIAHWEFVPVGKSGGKWKNINKTDGKKWSINYEDLTFELELTKFKHIGLFPEQADNWKYIKGFLKPQMRMLNLFAYTGAASIIGKSCGAEVIHVDAVKQMISWAKSNMLASKLEGIKWVHEDALKFAKRELKRGNHYDLIVMDPPAWGIGANKEKWKIEDQLEDLIKTASNLLNPNGRLILNTYSPKVELSAINTMASNYFDITNCETAELWMNTYSKKDVFFGHILRAIKNQK